MSKYQVREDFILFKELFKNKYKEFINKFNFKSKSTLKIYRNSKDILDILLQYDGASRIGAELLGKEIISGLPVTIYKLRRSTNDSDVFYIGYIQRNQNYQVVIDEEWMPFQENLSKAIKSSKKVIINLFVPEEKGGIKYGESKSKKSGRKKL